MPTFKEKKKKENKTFPQVKTRKTTKKNTQSKEDLNYSKTATYDTYISHYDIYRTFKFYNLFSFFTAQCSVSEKFTTVFGRLPEARQY